MKSKALLLTRRANLGVKGFAYAINEAAGADDQQLRAHRSADLKDGR